MKIQDRLGGLRLAKLPQRTDLEVTLRTEGNCRWLPSVNVLSKAYFYTQHAPGSHAEVRELLPEAPLAHCLQLRRLIAESTVRPASGAQNEDGEGKANL